MTKEGYTVGEIIPPVIRSSELLSAAAHFVLAHEGIFDGTTGKALDLHNTITAQYPYSQNQTILGDIRHQLQRAVGTAAEVSAGIKTWHAKRKFIERIDEELPGEPFRSSQEAYLTAKGLVRAYTV